MTVDALEPYVLQGAVAALRKRAQALARRAEFGTVRHEKIAGVMVRTSEAAHAADMARKLFAIANDLTAGGAPP